MKKDDYVIICGDFGGVWNKDKESKMETMVLDWLLYGSLYVLYEYKIKKNIFNTENKNRRMI